MKRKIKIEAHKSDLNKIINKLSYDFNIDSEDIELSKQDNKSYGYVIINVDLDKLIKVNFLEEE